MTENRTLDATKHHLEYAADPRIAGWHIAVFLLWAARRRLAARSHDVARIEPAPLAYLSSQAGDKLWTSDLTDVGARFALACYEDYLAELGDIAEANGLENHSMLASRPEGSDWAMEVLDELFEDWADGAG